MGWVVRATCAICALVTIGSCAAFVDLQKVDYGDLADASPAGPEAGDASMDAAVVAPGKPDASGADAGPCAVAADGKLHCTNAPNAALYAQPTSHSAITNTLRSTNSIFLCWTAGELHAGGNSTWYFTNGDDNPSFGYVPAVMLNTSDAFDADPTAFGLRKCSQ
jgi:hypothetical protein